MTTPTPRMLRLPEVIHITGLGRDSIYRLAAAGQFPKPRKISERASAWRSDLVLQWIESRPIAQLGVADCRGVPARAPAA